MNASTEINLQSSQQICRLKKSVTDIQTVSFPGLQAVMRSTGLNVRI